MLTVPTRQVHLDFHTSELIPDIGARFSRAQFQAALQAGHINSINLFAKCHHSWSYYPTKAGMVHPHLTFDLLGQQIEACHAIGVRAPIYFTVGWSANDAEMHPEWTVRTPDGTIRALNYDLNAGPEDPKPITSWKFLCPSGAYLDLILAQTRELCEGYVVDGFWYDITNGPVCYCDNCRAGMAAEGVDANDPLAAQAYNIRKWTRMMDACTAIIQAHYPEASIYFNGGANLYDDPAIHARQTHFELEDLPTTWGGYDKFPLRSRFFLNKGRPILAMSGKFHTTWGEFGGFKHPDALRYEAATMIAYGARCNFGDQLHPSGEMDLSTYRNIGEAFAYVEQIEAYGVPAEPYANLGLWLSGTTPHDQGVTNMLLESQLDFEVVDPAMDLARLARYQTIILTGGPLREADAPDKLQAYLAQGGSLLILGESAFVQKAQRPTLDRYAARNVKIETGPATPDADAPAFDLGARYLGPAHYRVDYLIAGPELSEGLVASPFLNYTAALRFAPTDAQVLATIREPYFDRTYGHYCSHQNTPYRLEDAPHAGALQKGRIVYLPHPLGALYYEHGARVHRQFFLNALKRLYTRPILATKMPSAGRVSLLHQPERRRYVAHLLYGPPLQRGRCLIIEDLVPLYQVPLALRVPQAIRRAVLPLQKQELAMQPVEGGVQVTVPEVICHQMVVFEY